MNFPTFLWVPSFASCTALQLATEFWYLLLTCKKQQGKPWVPLSVSKSRSGDATGIKGELTLSSPANQSQKQGKEELCKQFVKPPNQEEQDMAKYTAVWLLTVALLMIIAGSSAVPILATKIRRPSVVPRSSSTPDLSTLYETGKEATALCTARTSVKGLNKKEYYDSLLSVFLDLNKRSGYLQAKAKEYFDPDDELVRAHMHTHTHTHTRMHTHTHTHTRMHTHTHTHTQSNLLTEQFASTRCCKCTLNIVHALYTYAFYVFDISRMSVPPSSLAWTHHWTTWVPTSICLFTFRDA